jgi:hypothetical protein
VPSSEFERLLHVRAPHRTDEDAPVTREPVKPPRHEIQMLCVLALRDTEARRFLLSQNSSDALRQTPDSELLAKILDGDFEPDDPASLNAFLAQLSAGEEALVSGWLVGKLPPNPLPVAQGWWAGVQQAAVRRQLQIAEGRMKIPRLSTGEEVVLQKQIVDLRKQLDELSALSSARVLDT